MKKREKSIIRHARARHVALGMLAAEIKDSAAGSLTKAIRQSVE